MRTALGITAVMGSALVLAACSNNDGRSAVDRAEDKVAEGVGQVSANTFGSINAETYIVSASMGDLYEVRAADLALEHGQSDGVKELARMIKADHTQAAEKLRTAVSEPHKVEWLANDLDARRTGMIDNLAAAATGDFDKAYLEQQVAAHEEAIALHSGFSNETDETQLSNHARSVLPKIRAHLEKARELLAAAQ